MASTDNIHTSSLGATYGCLFLGTLFGSALWGAGCIQLYFYYEKFWKTDQNWLKAYILLVWVLDAVHQAPVIETTYVYFVSSMQNTLLLSQIPRSHRVKGFITAIIDSLAQAFFVRRAWYLSNQNRALIVILLVAVLAQFVLTTAYCAQIYKLELLTQIFERVHLELALSCTSTTTELLLSITMMWLLRRSRSGIPRTDSLINRLVVYTVGSGFVIGLWVIVALIAAVAAPHSFIYAAVDLYFPKLYFNCILALLNARASLRERFENEIVSMSFHVEGIHSVTAGTPTCPQCPSETSPRSLGGGAGSRPETNTLVCLP